MKTIVVKNQAELDALPDKFDEYTVIEIRGQAGFRISVTKAWENSSVEARENSSVVAWGNSSVVARGNSSVEAWGNSSVEAWGNSSVVARGNSSVEAWGNVAVRTQSAQPVELFGFSVAFILASIAKAVKKSKTATIITPKTKPSVDGWLEFQGIKSAPTVLLYKKVSKDFMTQEGTSNQTPWIVGSTVEHMLYDPKTEECGPGKFHACSRPYFCDEFRSVPGDRYVAIEVAKKDLYAWPNPSYPHKIAFRKGKVLYECDKMGKKLEVVAA